MKKLMIFLILVMLAGWGYYLWGNRKRLKMFRKEDSEMVTDYTERVRLEKELSKLQKEYDYLYQLCSSDSAAPEPKETDGEVAQLREENLELRRELDQIKNNKKTSQKPSQTVNTKNQNEKNIPVARNSRAVELQRFLTELYGDR